jgi:phosphoglycolate phosphatase
MSSAKRTVIFDFDGTLANTFDQLTLIYNQIAPFFRCLPVTSEQQSFLRGKKPQDLMRQFRISYLKLPLMLFVARRKLHKDIPHINIFDGIAQALQELRSAGYHLGIMTSNSPKNVKLFLDIHHLDSCFDFICSGWHIFKKDKVLNRLCKKHKIQKKDAAYVGDETRDIIAAKKMGLRVVAVSWGFNTKDSLTALKPEAMANSPWQLLQCIQSLWKV